MRDPKQRLKVAMIGVGDISMLHIPAYMDFEHAELATLCDVDEATLRRARVRFRIPKVTADYREVLADPDIDIVEVNTPHHLHKAMVIEALAAGKHVACQKPMTVRIDDAREIIEAARVARGRCRVLENFVFYPAYVKAKELIEAGEIGEPLTIRLKLGTSILGGRWVPLRTELWHLLEIDKGMGQAVYDDGYHKWSVARYLFGPIAKVTGFIERSFRYIDEPGQLIWRHEGSNVLGSFDLAFSPNLYTSSRYFPADERVDITGTKGSIRCTMCTGRVIDDAPLVLYRDGRRYAFDDLASDWQASFTTGIRDFPLAIKEGRDARISATTALEVMQSAYAAILAAKLGTEVAPADVTDEMIARELLGGAKA